MCKENPRNGNWGWGRETSPQQGWEGQIWLWSEAKWRAQVGTEPRTADPWEHNITSLCKACLAFQCLVHVYFYHCFEENITSCWRAIFIFVHTLTSPFLELCSNSAFSPPTFLAVKLPHPTEEQCDPDTHYISSASTLQKRKCKLRQQLYFMNTHSLVFPSWGGLLIYYQPVVTGRKKRICMKSFNKVVRNADTT